ncbi:sugar kinase [Amylibacter kogurei]|uniref:Sugar kinase n=1 Tax=Paramylibacter kogurei TaxID=1889778 RepID=A0A2G5K6R4_9RHOB|nr:ROK family transcriptional regulator [Amylibacter kogurei]PIB25228.1 sugar kinase [Amylibacter kogurei]
MNETPIIRALSNGANQKGVRDHNERLILSMLQRHGAMPGSDIARRTSLSAQTVSVILRKLESDEFLIKGTPQKGKVGKPSIPVELNPDAVFSFGVKIGRRSTELFLMNICGEILSQLRLDYDFALPQEIFAFLRNGIEKSTGELNPKLAARICGIGIAVPFEIWKWGENDANTPEEFLSWKDIDFTQELAKFCTLPVFVVNDATSACWAEHIYGRGKELRDYAYFFISTFIGGGIVINHSVYEGPHGNAGALGSLRAGDENGETRQLVDVASIHLLEDSLAKSGIAPQELWQQPQNWSHLSAFVDPWIEKTATEIAKASLSTCAVIDFEAIVIDGACPTDVRAKLVEQVQEKILQEDSRGLILPRIEEGRVGGKARAIGAACSPIFALFFLNSNSKLSD